MDDKYTELARRVDNLAVRIDKIEDSMAEQEPSIWQAIRHGDANLDALAARVDDLIAVTRPETAEVARSAGEAAFSDAWRAALRAELADLAAALAQPPRSNSPFHTRPPDVV